MTTSRDEMSRLIKQATTYRSGEDSCNSMYMGSLAKAVLFYILGGRYAQDIRVYQGLPSLDLVLSNPNGAKVPEDPSARFAISSGLSRKVTDKTIANAMVYMRRLPREFEILFMTDAVRRDSKLSHTQTFVDWTVRNQDVVFG